MALIEWSDALAVGVPEMDATHREFTELLNTLADAPAADWPHHYQRLLAHIEAHFAREEALMEESRFPAIAEHRAEHRRVLGDLRALGSRHRALAAAYVRELPAWFLLHRNTMDMATAVHLNRQRGAVLVGFPAA